MKRENFDKLVREILKREFKIGEVITLDDGGDKLTLTFVGGQYKLTILLDHLFWDIEVDLAEMTTEKSSLEEDLLFRLDRMLQELYYAEEIGEIGRVTHFLEKSGNNT